MCLMSAAVMQIEDPIATDFFTFFDMSNTSETARFNQ